MAIDDIPKFQAALAEDEDLRTRTREAIETMTAAGDGPYTQGSDLDWSTVAEIAGEVGVELDAGELNTAVFPGDTEWRRDDLVAVIGASDDDVEGFGFSFQLPGTFTFNDIVPTIKPSGDDTIHGVARDDTLDGGFSIGGGLGDDTIHG